MNIPTRVLKSTFITYDTYIQHQQLAKRFYKSNKALKKNSKSGEQNDTVKTPNENEHISLAIGEFKQGFKEDMIKWFFSLSLQEKIKAVSIENKWFSTMVLHMYSKYKYDQKIRFQLKLDDVPPDEYCYQQYFGANQAAYSTEMNLDNFFYYKNDRYIPEDRGINEILFLKELRYFSLREQNDTLTLSTNLLENEPLFKYFIDHFSNGKAFMQYCTVSFDNVFKVYNWDFPEWFNPRDYNSISEFIIAYIEQVLSIRFWYSLEEKKEKIAKNVPIANFSLYEEPNFTEIFDNREKLFQFLKTEYKENKEKLFNRVIDLKSILTGLKNDQSIMSKIKKPKQESIKNYFYLINKTKFELFEPPADNDHDIIEKMKRNYLENSDEVFIDELIFSQLENLNTLEDFMYKKLFDVLHNIYTEKNANELMSEEFSCSKKNLDQSKSKRGRAKKNVNKKKKNNSPEDKSSSPAETKVDKAKHDSFEQKSDEMIKDVGKIANMSSSAILENTRGVTLSGEKDKIETYCILNKPSDSSDGSKINEEKKDLNIITFNNNPIVKKEFHLYPTKEFSGVNIVNQTTNNQNNFKNNKRNYKTKPNLNNNYKYVTPNDDDDDEGKMSWRKGSNLSTLSTSAVKTVATCNNSENLPSKANKACIGLCALEDDKPTETKEEAYVNNFVKNLLSQIVTNDLVASKSSGELISNCSHAKDVQSSCSKDSSNGTSSNKKDSSDSNFIKGSKLIACSDASINLNNSKDMLHHVDNKDINKYKKQNKNFEKSDNSNSSNISNENSQSQGLITIHKKKNSKTLASPINKEYMQNYESKEIDKKEDKLEASFASLIQNSKNSKYYISDNDCKIQSINHEIIQNANSIYSKNNSNLTSRVMVDNFSQTDLKKEKLNENSSLGNLTLSETINSSTHDEDEKLKELNLGKDDKKKDNSSTSASASTGLPKNKKKTTLTSPKKEAEKILNIAGNTNLQQKYIIEKQKITENKPTSSGTNSNKTKHDILGLRKVTSEGNKPLSNMIPNSNTNNKPNFILRKESVYEATNSSNVIGNNARGPNFSNQFKKNNYQGRYHNANYNDINTENDDEFSIENEDDNANNYPYKKYNKGYYSNFYNKRNRFPYSFNNGNKFSNTDNGHIPPGKEINNRPLYPRNFVDFSPHINNFTPYTPIVGNVSMYNYGGNNGGFTPQEAPGSMKESSTYNNYYIINSNVNIKNVHHNGEAETEKNSVNMPNKQNNFSLENHFGNSLDSSNTHKVNLNDLVDTNSNAYAHHPNKSNPHSNMICNNYINVNLGDANKKIIISPMKSGIFSPMSPLNHYNPSNYPFYYGGKTEFKEETPSNSTNVMNQIGNDIYPFIFHYRLHNDILDYSNRVTQSINYLKEIKLYIITFLEKKIIESLHEHIMIDLYGSFATDLSIESSDIDITIKFEEEKTDLQIKDKIERLCYSFINLKLFETVTPITSASVPVIKILLDPLNILEENSEEMKIYKNLKDLDIFKNYKFDGEELLKVKVDLTFIQQSQCNKNYNKYQSTKTSLDWARKTLSIHPEIRPIIHVLKRYLQIKKLNSSFNGGLSSFSLFLIIIAYLKHPKVKTRINLGRILMELLEVYGKFFNYAQTVIDVNLFNPYVIANEVLETIPIILDPVTGLNVAKNSFRIEEVRESLAAAYDMLNNYKLLFDKKDLASGTNIVFDLLLKCNGDTK